MTELRLDGCRTQPLGGYLKAIAVLRLVAEQADPDATGWWAADTMRLASGLDRDALVTFFVERYMPTPVVAPWNGGSGFQPQDKMPRDHVDRLMTTETDRLVGYRQTAKAALTLMSDHVVAGKVADTAKDAIRLSCRNRLPDEALAWFDASVVLAGDRSVFPPLLGTGGNDGKLEFSNNYLRHVLAVVTGADGPNRQDVERLLVGALFGEDPGRMAQASVGQFAPGSAGAANSGPVEAAPSLVNPWDFVLLCEGAMLFAANAARRMGSDTRGRAAIPFTVQASSVGVGNAADRGEVWLPLWERPATASEVAYLLGEGRAEWNGRQAKRSVDVVRALASLGVQRGTTHFVRYAIDVRMGRQMLAVPAGRFAVRDVPEIVLLRDLDGWLDRIRNRLDTAPGGVRSEFNRVEAAMFRVAGASSGGRSRALQELLTTVAELEAVLARATSFRSGAGIRPLPWLDGARWVPALDDASPEFGVAAALALQCDARDAGLRRLVKPIAIDAHGRAKGWSDGSSLVAGLGVRPIVDVLAEALVRRLQELALAREDRDDDVVGVLAASAFGPAAPRAACEAFAAGALDTRRLNALVCALLLLRPGQQVDLRHGAFDAPLEPGWRLLAPFFARQRGPRAGTPADSGPRASGHRSFSARHRATQLRVEPRWASLLTSGALGAVLDAAHRRARIAGLEPALRVRGVESAVRRPVDTGRRWAASLLPALSMYSGWVLRDWMAPVLDPLDSDTDAHDYSPPATQEQ